MDVMDTTSYDQVADTHIHMLCTLILAHGQIKVEGQLSILCMVNSQAIS